MKTARFFLKTFAASLILALGLPHPAFSLRGEQLSDNPPARVGLEEQLRQTGGEASPAPILAGLEEEPAPQTVVNLTPGQTLTEEDLRQWERNTFVPHVRWLIGRNFRMYPPRTRILWDVGAYTGEVAQELVPLFSQGPNDRVIAFEKSRSEALSTLWKKSGRHFQVVEGDFRRFVEEEGQQPTVVLASHVLYYFGRRERIDIVDAMLNSLPPGRPLLIVLNDIQPVEGGRSHFRDAMLGRERQPLDPSSLEATLKNRDVEVEKRKVTLEIRGGAAEVAGAAGLFLGRSRKERMEETRQYVRQFCRTDQEGVYALTATQVILVGTKPIPPEAVRLPPRMQEVLGQLNEAQRERLFGIMTDEETSEERRVHDFWAVLEGSAIWHRMSSAEREAVYREIGHPTRGFTQRESLMNLLYLVVGRADIRGLVSADSEIPSGPTLPQALVDLRQYARLLEPSDQVEIRDLFHRVILQQAPMVRNSELGRVHLFLTRLMGLPRHPRLFSVREITRAYPEMEGFLQEGDYPLTIRRTLEGGGRLRFSEIQQVVIAYRQANRARLPRSLDLYREILSILSGSPLPRLMPHLPEPADPNALWDPFQVELLQAYAEAVVLSLLAQTGTPAHLPDWAPDTGVRNGVQDFPPVLSRSLSNAQSFVERVLVIAEFLGWNDRQLCLIAGVSPHLVSDWRRRHAAQPYDPHEILRFAAAVRVDPVFLLTGQPLQVALRDGPPARRAALLLQARGLSQSDAGRMLGITQAGVQRTLKSKKWERETLFTWAEECLGEDPTVLEFGRPAPRPKPLAQGDYGFTRKAETAVREYAQDLHPRVVRAMEQLRGKATVDAWRQQIDPAPGTGYHGLVAKTLEAYPDTLDRMVGYGFPADIADKFHQRRPLTNEETRRLARYWAETYEALEDLFACAPEYHPARAGGYGNRSQHVFDTWHLVARGFTAQRFLSIANQARLTLGQMKSKVLVSPDPEGEIAQREQLLGELAERFAPEGDPHAVFSRTAVRNYVWTGNPQEALEKARNFHSELLDLANRGWIRAFRADRGGAPVPPQTLARMLVRTPYRAGPILEQIRERNAAFRAALSSSPHSERLRAGAMQAGATWLMAYQPEDSQEEFPVDYLCALDLLNRAAAYRQADDPAFLRTPTPEVVEQLLGRTTQILEQQMAASAPRSQEELETLIRQIAAGLEEPPPDPDRTIAQLAEASQGAGILVVGPEIWETRAGLEEFVRRAPPDLLKRIIFFGLGAAPGNRLRELNPAAQIVQEDDLTTLTIFLLSLPQADRVAVLGTAALAQELRRTMPASVAVTHLDLGVAFRLILSSLGVPEAVLDQIDAAGLEEQLARAA